MSNLQEKIIAWHNRPDNRQSVSARKITPGSQLKTTVKQNLPNERRGLSLERFENPHCAFAILDRDLNCLFMNQSFKQRFDQINRQEQNPDQHSLRLTIQWQQACAEALAGSNCAPGEPPFGFTQSAEDLCQWKCHPWYEPAGTIGGVIISAEHGCMPRSLGMDTGQLPAFYRAALDQIKTGLALITLKGMRICWENKACREIIASLDPAARDGLLPGILKARYVKSGEDPAGDPQTLATQTKPYIRPDGQSGWLRLTLKNCTEKAVPQPACWLIIEEATVSASREQELSFLKQHDMLTQLHNRAYFNEARHQLDQPDQLPLSVVICDINGLKSINETRGYLYGDRVLLAAAGVLRGCCRSGDVLARTGGDEFYLLMPRTTPADAAKIRVDLMVKMAAVLKHEGYDDDASLISIGLACKESADESLDHILKLAEDRLLRQKLTARKSLHHTMLASLKATMVEKSVQTNWHGERLVSLTRMLGEHLALSDGQLQELELLAHVHDMGKIIISDEIINKPGKLTAAEWAQMKKHPEIGFRIAEASPDICHIAAGILHHHEHWDGKGYPRRLQGEDIPLMSRILAIADAYDAMTNDRPYRQAMTHEEALQEISRCAGTQFDPCLARQFCQLMS